MRKPAVTTLLLAVALHVAGLSLVNAGSYRRPVVAMGTVTVQSNQTVFGLLADCFDVPVFDFCTGERVGSLFECLSDPEPVPDCTGALNMTATSIFTIDGSTFVYRAFISGVPVSATAAPTKYTHITGYFPPTSPVEGLGILQATDDLEGAVGTVRLSGAINRDNVQNGEVTFNCIFLIDVETSSGIDYEYSFQRAGSMALKQQLFLTLLMTVLGIQTIKIF